MKAWGLALALAVPVAVVSVAHAASEPVEMRASSSQPAMVEIAVNDTVEWVHRGGGAHTVTADDGSFDSSPNCNRALGLGCINGGSYTRQFTRDGTFAYHCKVHGAPGGQGMSGVVVVKPATATPTTVPASATTTSRPRLTTTSQAAVTTTSRPLSTSSTAPMRSTTTTVPEVVFDVEPNEPPPFDPGEEVAGRGAEASSEKKSDPDTVAVIVALLLAVASGGGLLLWRLRPGPS
jgi:plastocyanin